MTLFEPSCMLNPKKSKRAAGAPLLASSRSTTAQKNASAAARCDICVDSCTTTSMSAEQSQ